MTRPARGLSLVELLVSVAILAILAAIAMPHFAEARMRAKVARAKNDLRVVASAAETYCADHGSYPAGRPTPGRDPYGVFARSALSSLTTPVAYLAAANLEDPFGPLLPAIAHSAGPESISMNRGGGFPFPSGPPAASMLYFEYERFAQLRENPRLRAAGFAIISAGPDRRDSFSVYYPFPDELPAQAASFGLRSAADTIYDPTNGVVSAGDIGRWGGAVPARPAP